MTFSRSLSIFSPALLALAGVLAVACTDAGAGTSQNQAQATSVATDIKAALEAITTPEAAASAKSKLEGLVSQLAAAMPKSATELATSLGGDLGKVIKGITDQITRISADSKLLEPIKGVIEQLKGVIAGK